MLLKKLKNKNKRLLVIGAHPDDVEFSTGRLILQRNGQNTFVVIMTDGRKGQSNQEVKIPEEDFALVRLKESCNALKKLKITSNYFFLKYHDQDLVSKPSAINEIKEIILKLNPDYILIPPYEGAHPDHDATHVFTVLASRKIGFSKKIVEYSSYNQHNGSYNLQKFIPKEEKEVTLMPKQNEQKIWIDAMKEFHSQLSLQKIEIPMSKFEKYRVLPKYNYTTLPYSSNFCFFIRTICSPLYLIIKKILPKKEKLYYENWSHINPLKVHQKLKVVVEADIE